MEGLVFFGSLFSLLPIVVLLVVLVVIALRQDDDVSDDRAPAFYGAVVALLGLLTVLVAVTGVASGLMGLTEDSGGDFGRPMPMYEDEGFRGRFSADEGHDEDWRNIVAAGIAVGAAVALLAVHRPLLDRRKGATGTTRRVYRAYLAVMALVTAIVAVVAGAVVVFDIFKFIAPGVFGNGDRADAARDAVPLIVLFLGAAGLWRWHWAELGFGPAPQEVSAADAP